MKKGTPNYIINIRANASARCAWFFRPETAVYFSNDAKENKVKGMPMRRQIFKQP